MDSLRSMVDPIKETYETNNGSGEKYVGNYSLHNVHHTYITVCYSESTESDYSFWRTVGTKNSHSPYLFIQISLMILLINLLHFFLKPLRQPRLIAGILGGIILGPSVFGNLDWVMTHIHPLQTIPAATTIGNTGILFYIFLVGLEIDIAAMKSIRKVKFLSAAIGVVVPLVFGVISYYFLVREREHRHPTAYAWWSISLSLSSFPELVQILSEFKLLHREIGRNALNASLVNLVVGWILMTITIATSFNYFILLTSVSFILLWWFVVRQAVCWAIEHTCSDEGRYNDNQVYFVLIGMLLSGFISELCGLQAYLGAFIFGLIIPRGELGVMVVETIEDLITVIMLPIFFMDNGNKVLLYSVLSEVKASALIASLAMTSTSKLITTFTISIVDGRTVPDSLTLGALSNSKGILSLVLINAARNVGVFDGPLFTISLLSIMITASTVKPIMIVAGMFKEPVVQYDYVGKTSVEIKSKFAEFRILTCIPSTRYVAGIVKLLEMSNPTGQSPLRIFSAHLIELTESITTTMLILDEAFETHVPNVTHQKADSEQIANTLEKYRLRTGANVSIQPVQVTSAYGTMHEDVCFLAKEHRTNMILLPFHKFPNIHGVLRCENACLRDVNKKILANATCPVALLVDRGLSSRTCFGFENQTKYKLAMIFLGGPDDREALAYAHRMAGSPNIRLCVLRFLLSTDAEKDHVSSLNAEKSLTLTEEKLERMLDDEYAKQFIAKTLHSRSITFMEARVNSTEQMLTTIRTLFDDFDLLIVGKGKRTGSPLTIGLSSEWNECEELGILADTLVASEFTNRISILVVRHYHVSPSRTLTRSSNHHEVSMQKSRLSMCDRL